MALAFDNWRVLHGRSAFTGDREMCGAYSQSFLGILALNDIANIISEHGRSHIEVEDVELP